MRNCILKVLSLTIICLLPLKAATQQVYTDYRDLDGTLQVGPTEDIKLDRTERGYTLLLPDYQNKPRGLVIAFEGRRITLQNIPEDLLLHPHAFRRGLGVLYVSTGMPADFFFEESRMIFVTDLIQKTFRRYDLPTDELFYTGFSIGGTQALKFTIFCKNNPQKCPFLPDAVAVIDAPLDMTRFWHTTERAEKIDFHPAASGEGYWVSHWLEKNLGGTPDEVPVAYINYSPYTYTAEHVDHLGGNARYLRDIPIRTYAEPDITWKIKHRRQSYY
ncbi:MAG: hypothetical protein R3281_10835 [Balneolaceae bacterium]|nr:hypothetical protein [Balneolaceae bacterium]